MRKVRIWSRQMRLNHCVNSCKKHRIGIWEVAMCSQASMRESLLIWELKFRGFRAILVIITERRRSISERLRSSESSLKQRRRIAKERLLNCRNCANSLSKCVLSSIKTRVKLRMNSRKKFACWRTSYECKRVVQRCQQKNWPASELNSWRKTNESMSYQA